jgi:hypothetical protein
MSFRAIALFGIALFGGVLSAACASKSTSSSSGTNPGQDPGLTPGGDDVAGKDVNPDGVPYPTDHLGFKARNNSTINTAPPGDRISNFKFLGYKNGDQSQGLQPVSLADYYDPDGKNYKIIHISVSGVWCTWCIAETKALVPLIPQLKDKKVVYLTALSEDINHQPAKQSDLDYWMKKYQPGYTQVLDPGNAKLGPFFTSAGIPWNGNFDARSMEVLSSITSAPSSDGTTIDIMGDIDPWLEWYDHNPPAYTAAK